MRSGPGADIEAGGAVIGGGTPMADAVAFGPWKAARACERRANTGKRPHSASSTASAPAHANAAHTAGARQRAVGPPMAGNGTRPSCCSTAAPTRAGSDTTTFTAAAAAERSEALA